MAGCSDALSWNCICHQQLSSAACVIILMPCTCGPSGRSPAGRMAVSPLVNAGTRSLPKHFMLVQDVTHCCCSPLQVIAVTSDTEILGKALNHKKLGERKNVNLPGALTVA